MSFKLILLVLLSGFVHATWNFFAKKSKDKLTFFYIVKIIQTVIYLPLIIYILSRNPVLSKAIPYIIASGLIHTVYWYSLGEAYTYGDLSIVYPIARSAPAVIPIFSFLFLGERLTLWGIIGIILVSIGVYLLTFEHGQFKETLRKIFGFKEKGIIFSYITLITVVAFSLNDKKASSLVDPIAYVYLFEIVSLIGLTPVMFLRKKTTEIKKEFGHNFINLLLSGVMVILSYALIIYTMKYSLVSYVTSVRQVGIVFGVLFGVIFLKEDYGLRRIISSVLITLGIIIIGLFG